MPGVQPIKGISADCNTISTARSRADNSHAYIASRINDLYNQALSRQPDTLLSSRTLKRFIDSNTSDGRKLHKIV